MGCLSREMADFITSIGLYLHFQNELSLDLQEVISTVVGWQSLSHQQTMDISRAKVERNVELVSQGEHVC